MGWMGKETLKLTGGEQDTIVLLESDVLEGSTLEIGSIEIDINLKKWYSFAHAHPKCKKCHKKLGLWEIAVNVQHYYQNKKKGRVSFKCWSCASEDM